MEMTFKDKETALRFKAAMEEGIRRNTNTYIHPVTKQPVEAVMVAGVETYVRDKGWKGLRNGLIDDLVKEMSGKSQQGKLAGAVKGVRTAYVRF